MIPGRDQIASRENPYVRQSTKRLSAGGLHISVQFQRGIRRIERADGKGVVEIRPLNRVSQAILPENARNLK